MYVAFIVRKPLAMLYLNRKVLVDFSILNISILVLILSKLNMAMSSYHLS